MVHDSQVWKVLPARKWSQGGSRCPCLPSRLLVAHHILDRAVKRSRVGEGVSRLGSNISQNNESRKGKLENGYLERVSSGSRNGALVSPGRLALTLVPW